VLGAEVATRFDHNRGVRQFGEPALIGCMDRSIRWDEDGVV